jgi:hypothetical protein
VDQARLAQTADGFVLAPPCRPRKLWGASWSLCYCSAVHWISEYSTEEIGLLALVISTVLASIMKVLDTYSRIGGDFTASYFSPGLEIPWPVTGGGERQGSDPGRLAVHSQTGD